MSCASLEQQGLGQVPGQVPKIPKAAVTTVKGHHLQQGAWPGQAPKAVNTIIKYHRLQQQGAGRWMVMVPVPTRCPPTHNTRDSSSQFSSGKSMGGMTSTTLQLERRLDRPSNHHHHNTLAPHRLGPFLIINQAPHT